MRVRIAAPLCNFNPRSHERSDETYKTLYISDLISIHAPTRGATVFRRAERNSCRISIHAPTRGATIPNIDIPDVAGFQSTLPREERPFSATIEGLFLDFNPRSHERSDKGY